MTARLLLGVVVAAVLTAFSGGYAAAQDHEFTVELNDGKVTPNRLEVPANTRFVLIVKNSGKTAAEFESKSLRKEVVIAPGATSKLSIKKLSAGEYEFFDEFHPDESKSVLVAK